MVTRTCLIVHCLSYSIQPQGDTSILWSRRKKLNSREMLGAHGRDYVTNKRCVAGNVMWYILWIVFRRFGGTCCLHQQLTLTIIVDNDQLDTHLLYFTTHLLWSSTCFEHYMIIIRRLNCIDAASGIVTLSKWPSGAQVERELLCSSLSTWCTI